MANALPDAAAQEDLTDVLAAQKALIAQILVDLEGKTAGSEAPDPVVQSLEVTENGTYEAPNGVTGYTPVSVNVPIPDGYIVPAGELGITENGVYDVTKYASVEVSLPATGSGSSGQYAEGTVTVAAEVSELTVEVGFVPDIFIATVTGLSATSGMKTLTWVKSDILVLTDIQNVGTGVHSFKAEDYTEITDNGIKIKRYGSYNIPIGTLNYRAYKN